MITLLFIALAAFAFKFFRELEDEILKDESKNFNVLKFREGETTPSTLKWKYPLEPYTAKWYHFGFKCNHAERFAFSSTWLVGIFDGEHFYQLVQTLSLIALIVLSSVYAIWYEALFSAAVGGILAGAIKEKIKGIN
jgi:hypothetical protein